PISRTHCNTPFSHVVRPNEHCPLDGEHTKPTSVSLSTLSGTPSQSSSLPLHVSLLGPTAPTHLICPRLHTVWPSLHSPTLDSPHVLPTRESFCPTGVASSTTPLQSLSRPSQISTPPLVGLQKYSQPSSGLPLMSW